MIPKAVPKPIVTLAIKVSTSLPLPKTKIETGYLGIPQLYDMKQAGEKVNLATEHPEKVFELQQILRKVRDKSIQMK